MVTGFGAEGEQAPGPGLAAGQQLAVGRVVAGKGEGPAVRVLSRRALTSSPQPTRPGLWLPSLRRT